jgi:branched-chain amino acid transport system substrate-binding protein
MMNGFPLGALVAFAMLRVAAAQADEVKVGIAASFSGPFSVWGKEYREAIDLYLEQIGGKAGGHSINIVYGDVGGANPARARQLAQEMVVRDGVAILGGHELTPNVLAVTDVINESKVPFVIFNTGTANVTDKSPYFVRVGFTQWATYYPLGKYAAQQGMKNCAAVAANYAPGQDSIAAVKKGFGEGGGTLVDEIMTPLETTDFSPYLQRIRDRSPQCTFVFMPLGPMSVTFIKSYNDRGLSKAGIQLFGQSETAEFDLPTIGDGALGVITAQPYGPNLDNAANHAFIEAFKAKYGKDRLPTVIALLGYDGMRVIAKMIEGTDGKRDGDKAVAAVKGFSWQSPRGPVTIDPRTREPIENIYIRKVVKEDGALVNKEVYTFEGQKEPWHELNP